MNRLRITIVILILCISQISAAQDKLLVLQGATLIDVDSFGLSTHDIPNAVVIISQGKIVAVGSAGKIKIPAGATIIDVKGKYIVPGLIDGFGSVTNQAFANAYLYLGITTVVTAEDDRRGKTFLHANPSPALYRQDAFWGADRVPSTKPNQLYENINYRTDAQIKHEIDSMAHHGAKVMLIHYGVKKEQLPAIIGACKNNNIATIGELGFTNYADAVAAGVQSFIHVSRYTADILPDSIRIPYSNAPFGPPARKYYDHLLTPGILNSPRLQALISLYGRHRIGLMATESLQVYSYMPFHRNPWKEPAASLIDEKDIIHEPLNKETGKPVNPPAFRAQVAPVMHSMDSLFAAHGARFLAGSGATAFGTLPGIGLHTELECLSHLGLSNRQVLAAATHNYSLLWGWRHIGKIEAGRDADILVLPGDPTTSLQHLKNADLLLLKGKLNNRQQLLVRR